MKTKLILLSLLTLGFTACAPAPEVDDQALLPPQPDQNDTRPRDDMQQPDPDIIFEEELEPPILEPQDPDPFVLTTPEAYVLSPYRVLHVIKHPEAPYSIVVATDRSEDGNDSICGSIYSSPTCYFFVEGDYHVDAPETAFITSYTTGEDEIRGAFDPASVEFIDENNITFKALDGDAGQIWGAEANLNLQDKTITKIRNLDNDNFDQ